MYDKYYGDMTMLAFIMFVSLIILMVNSFDPRLASKADITNTFVKLCLGVLLGFFIILLYGVGVPGLKYLFAFIGFGGIAHLFLSYKSPESYRA
jgi:hypothetical protein